MRKPLLIVIVVVLFLMPLSACRTGAREIDENLYVFSIGVDKGVSDKLRFTFQFPSLSGKQTQSGGGSSGTENRTGSDLATITIDCPTLYSGITMIYSSFSRRLDLTHTKYLIIAEDLARESIAPFMNGMSRNAEVRGTMWAIVCKGKASDFIKEMTPFAGASVPKSQELIMENAEFSALYDTVIYNQLAMDLKSRYTQGTATLAALNEFSSFKEEGEQTKEFKSEGDYSAGEQPRQSDNKFEFLGTAVFNGSTLVGELNGNETRALLMIRGEYEASSIVIQDPFDPKLRISSYVFEKKNPDIKITFHEGKVNIQVKVFLEGSLQNVQSAMNIEKAHMPEVEDAYKKFIKEKLDQTIKKCQELNCDVFDFGYKAAAQFWTIQDWEKYDWLSHFKDTQVTTEVEFIIRRTGTMIMTEEEKKTEG